MAARDALRQLWAEWGEWARREPHNLEYIGKNEQTGEVVLRVVLSDAIPSNPVDLIAALKRRFAAMIEQLEQSNQWIQ